MSNFGRNSGRGAFNHYQPNMKKRGPGTENSSAGEPLIEESKPPQQSAIPQPPVEPIQPPPPPQSPQPPQKPNRPNHPVGPRPPYHRPQPPRQPNYRQSVQQENLPKPNSEQLDNLVNTASQHLNTSPEELKKAAQSGNMQKLFSQMSPSQAQQLQKILSDENAAKKLLSTPQAQAILRGLSKNE